MEKHIRKFLIEGLDRTGKDSLIAGIKNKRGFHQVLHFSKPEKLDLYAYWPYETPGDGGTNPRALEDYQSDSFRNMFNMLREPNSKIICNRAHLGECVYAPLYRGYDGDYVFDLEDWYDASTLPDTRLILLTEDFSVSKHFVDDGESFDITKREKEQELFLAAFEKSSIADKRIVSVTAKAGNFRSRGEILNDVLK